MIKVISTAPHRYRAQSEHQFIPNPTHINGPCKSIDFPTYCMYAPQQVAELQYYSRQHFWRARWRG